MCNFNGQAQCGQVLISDMFAVLHKCCQKMPPVLQEIIIVTVFPCRARRRRFPSLTAIRMASRHPRNLAWARAYLGRICPTHAHASERRSEEIRV